MEFSLDKYYLKSSSFFDFLSKAETQLVKSKLLRKEYSKAEFLFKENSFSRGIYIIRKGKVKIFQTNADGKQSVVYIYKKGDYFGYRPLLAEEPHPVSAVAMDNVVLSFIPKEVFFAVYSKSASLPKNLLYNLTKEFSVWIHKMTVFSQYGVKERVALSLLILNRVYKRDELKNKNQKVVISINRDDFAGFVGTAKETLVRMLRLFKDEKIIVTKGTKIIVQRPKALYHIVADL